MEGTKQGSKQLPWKKTGIASANLICYACMVRILSEVPLHAGSTNSTKQLPGHSRFMLDSGQSRFAHTQSVFPGKAVLQQCLQNLWLHGAAELGKGSEHAAHDSGISCCYASSDGLQVLGDGFQQNHPHSALPVAHWHQQVDIDWLDYNIYSLYFTMIIYISL